MSRYIPNSEKEALLMKSGRRCAICNTDLFDKTSKNEELNISEKAHIKAFGEKGPRADSNMDISEKNKEENLILLCISCHRKIDKDPNTYTAEKLFEIKKAHENKVIEKLNDSVTNIDFAELEDIVKYLVLDQITIREEYKIIKPTEKINKNNLSEQVAQLIVRGMIGADQVSRYLERHPDIYYGDRIKEKFVVEYKRLQNEEKLTGDNLFWSLWDFASLHINKTKNTSAGLSILVYLFETCEVFEK